MTGISIDFEIDADWFVDVSGPDEDGQMAVMFCDQSTQSEVTVRGDRDQLRRLFAKADFRGGPR